MDTLLGSEEINETEINIYADEVQDRIDPNTSDKWHYIGLIIEDCKTPLLNELIKLRYCNNFDKKSPYYEKNDCCLHWVDIDSADEINILKRWFDYVCSPDKDSWNYCGRNFCVLPSKKTFRFYMLGINSSKLNDEEFNPQDDFGSKYNRFFRTAILYSVKKYFPNKKIIIKNIFHEQGVQENNYYFPWYCIYKIGQDHLITTESHSIEFLPKDHKINERSNIIQLCDCFLGASVNILHGMNYQSDRGSVKKEILDKYQLPLFKRIVENPTNRNSNYNYFRRISVSFFPKNATKIDSLERMKKQFYVNRRLQYELDRVGQRSLFQLL